MRCDQGKRTYHSLGEAEHTIARFAKQWGPDDLLLENLNAYQCGFCHKWHLGHKGGKTDDQRLLESIRRIRRM